MAENVFERMEILFGSEAMAALAAKHVVLLGIGGVGGHCAEALARCGIGRFTLVDGDRVSLSNINRQAVAFRSTVGEHKVDVMRARIADINPAARVETCAGYFTAEDDLGIWDNAPDIVIDAIDMVTAKVALAVGAQQRGIACVSCMGAGNKLDPMQFEAADLFDTSVCPLCRATRKLGKQQGLERLRVVYSKEMPAPPQKTVLSAQTGRPVPGSVVFVTATAGLLLAHEAVKLLLSTPGM